MEMNDDIFGSVADEHYERALLLLYSIANQRWNARVSTRLLVLAYKVMAAACSKALELQMVHLYVNNQAAQTYTAFLTILLDVHKTPWRTTARKQNRQRDSFSRI